MTAQQTLESFNTPALYPRSVPPAPGALPFHRFIIRYLRNPLSTIPAAAYGEPMVVQKRGATSGKIVWLMDPALTQQVLLDRVAEFRKSDVERRVLGKLLGESVLTSDGARWRWQRRTMAPLFRPLDILRYVPVMAQAGEEQLALWRKSGAGIKDIDHAMTDVTFAVIARTMLVGGDAIEMSLLRQAGDRYFSNVPWEGLWATLKLPVWLPHPGTLGMRSAVATIRGGVQALIDRRRGLHGKGEGSDLLGRLIAARDPETGDAMTDAELIDNLLTLLGAGHETTAKALTWTLYLLARSPAWQDRLRREVDEVAGDAPLEARHLEGLTLTQQVLKESMRLYPPVAVMARIFNDAGDVGGESFRAGDLVRFPIFCIHRHRKLWDDPDRFDPGRFSPATEKTYPRTQFMPFGAGPRVCIGNAFALAEGTAILAALIRGARFDWTCGEEPEPISRITLQPGGGMRLAVTLL